MRILAIETTDRSGSVALLEGNRVVASRDLDPAVRSAVSLAPAIVGLLQEAKWQTHDGQLVAVAAGPGSFTGLRVGVTTAKMFAYAVGAEALGVNTLEVIAWQAPDNVRQLWTVLDAQREQLFAGRFCRDATGQWQWRGEAMLLDHDAWFAQLTTKDAEHMAVSGPGLVKIVGRIPKSVSIIDSALWPPKAATVGQLAWRQYQAGRRTELGALAPEYFRPSAAEEKRAATARSSVT